MPEHEGKCASSNITITLLNVLLRSSPQRNQFIAFLCLE